MKYAAHIYLWTDCWADSEVGLFARAKALGIDLLEISIGDDVKFDATLTKQAAADAGMGIVIGPGGQWPDHADLSGDEPAHRQLAYDWHRQQIDSAVAMGASTYSGAIYGRPGVSLRRRPRWMNTHARRKACTVWPTMRSRRVCSWASSR